MANYNKQFNFRNGVQVDDDNLVVSPTGLVGIGTTVPTELLDVRGDVKISGFATATELKGQNLVVSGIATFKEIKLESDSIIVGSGVSIGSGVVTASDPTGIVTYYGDARYLQGMPTSQWLDVDAGLGFISVYNAGNVGVGTDDPRFMLQIGGNTDMSVAGFAPGVGISSEGNVIATGIVTASGFVGIGSLLTSLNADELVSGTVNNDRLPEDIQITGIATATTFNGQLNTTGIATASSFIGDLTGNLTGDEIVITGIITATSLDGDVVGTASTALTLSGTPDIEVSNIISGIITGTRFEGDVIGTATTATDLPSNANITIDKITVGISSVKSILGVGTNPLTGNITVGVTTSGIGADILVDRFAGINTTTGGSASLRLLSDKEESVITIGSSTVISGSNAQIRYGNRNTSVIYSTENSLDFINYGDGNINYYLQYNSTGIGTGNFHWHNNNSVITSLTYEGNLGLGITNPSQRLNVQGISTFSGDAFFNSDVTIDGNLTISSLNVSSVNANLFGNVTGDGISSGISTFNVVSVGVTATVEGQVIIGTGVTVPSFIPLAVNPGEGQFFIDDTSSVGINTDIIGDPFVLDVHGSIFGTSVSVGTTIPQASVDFANAGIGTNIGFMIPPKVSDAERVGLATVTGAFIYNTTSNKLQVYTGSSWETITSA